MAYFYSAQYGRHSVFFTAMFDEAIRDLAALGNAPFSRIWLSHLCAHGIHAYPQRQRCDLRTQADRPCESMGDAKKMRG
jgi:hypothetical protein